MFFRRLLFPVSKFSFPRFCGERETLCLLREQRTLVVMIHRLTLLPALSFNSCFSSKLPFSNRLRGFLYLGVFHFHPRLLLLSCYPQRRFVFPRVSLLSFFGHVLLFRLLLKTNTQSSKLLHTLFYTAINQSINLSSVL